jgi:branched-chain amino acid transport system permease protein
LEILIYGAVTSAIYALLAVGFTLIFGVARILNLAHGSFHALGADGTYVPIIDQQARLCEDRLGF